MAHVNTAGVHVPIWLDAVAPAIGWGISTAYPYQEGSFFGNIITTGSLANTGKSSITGPAAYYCDGAGFTPGSNGEVAGRLGVSSTGSPYTNPFGDGVLCNQSPGVGSYWSGAMYNSDGTLKYPDGYTALKTNNVTWNQSITVWRTANYTPVFDSGFRYVLSSLVTRNSPMVLDAATSPVVQQPMSSNLSTTQFALNAVGSNWTISMASSPGKCLDAGSGADNQPVTLQNCNANSAAQQWNINPQGNTFGAFWIKNVAAGNYLTVGGTSTTQKYAGAPFWVMPYNRTFSSQQYRIQVVTVVN
jgi:Ricin-type beta-trefoil lectin domain-like